MIIGEGIKISEFVSRRQTALDRLDRAIGLVFAGDGPPPLSGVWDPDWHFHYLTGIREEPGSGVLLAAGGATGEASHAAGGGSGRGFKGGVGRGAWGDGLRRGGGVGTGYNSIVGAGINSCVLHYHSNNQPLEDGDVILIDAAARVGGY